MEISKRPGIGLARELVTLGPRLLSDSPQSFFDSEYPTQPNTWGYRVSLDYSSVAGIVALQLYSGSKKQCHHSTVLQSNNKTEQKFYQATKLGFYNGTKPHIHTSTKPQSNIRTETYECSFQKLAAARLKVCNAVRLKIAVP